MNATESDSYTIVDVAVGVVTHVDGRVLLAERPQGKQSAGYPVTGGLLSQPPGTATRSRTGR